MCGPNLMANFVEVCEYFKILNSESNIFLFDYLNETNRTKQITYVQNYLK